MRSPALLLLLALGCSPAAPSRAPATGATDTHAAPPALYALEARGRAATPELIARSEHDLAALRSLGRVGDPPAIAALLVALGHADRARREAAAAALGVAALLDSDVGDAEARLLSLWDRVDPDEQIGVVETLGRLGSAAALPALRASLQADRPAPLQDAAALAIGRLGRRKIVIDPDTRARLLALARTPTTASASLAVTSNYPVVYALASEHAPGPDPAVEALLLDVNHDTATALLGLQGAIRRHPGAPSLLQCIARAPAPRRLFSTPRRLLRQLERTVSEQTLIDELVYLENLVVLTPVAPTPQLDKARHLQYVLACVLEATHAAIGPAAQAAVHSLRAEVQRVLATPDAASTGALTATRRTLARVDCQLAQLLAHDPKWRLPLVCGGDLIPPDERETLTPLLLADGFGGAWSERHALLADRLRATSTQVRIAAVTAVARMWDDPALAPSVEGWLLAALDDRSLGVVGAAADAITARFKRDPAPKIGPEDPLWRSLAAKAGAALDREPELYTTLVATLAATRLPAGAAACQPALRHVNASVRKAARDCLKDLGLPDPGPQPPAAAASPPPLDPAPLQGKSVRWILQTEYGPLHVTLDPDVAPWAVAMLVELTRRGFYDGLLFHRDVPGFVLQGGDPEGTGWGGPGFTLPSEPSTRRFDRGAVGIADAGRDTGGSQFFFMHARAPHLEGRYTWVGQVDAPDLDRLELLTIGDRILKAEIQVTEAVRSDMSKQPAP